MLSDDSTSDSDSGVRFKTDSTRRQQPSDGALLDRNKGGRNNPRFDAGPGGRGRSGGFFPGNRDRQERRSPPKGRDRSPQRNRDRFNNDRFPRSDRAREERPREERPREERGREERPREERGREERGREERSREERPREERGREERSREERAREERPREERPREERPREERPREERPRDDRQREERQREERPREERLRIDFSRQRVTSPNQERPRDIQNERTSSRDDRPERNGSKRNSQQRTSHSRENSESFRPREKVVERVDPKEVEQRREYDARRHQEKTERSNPREVKDRLNLKPERQISEKSSRVTPPPPRQINRQALQGIRKIIKDDVNSRERDSVSSSRPRTISPIRFGKNSGNAERHSSRVKSVSTERDKKRKASPVLDSPPLQESNPKITRKSESPVPDISDSEPKPVSYYNMISNIPHVSDNESGKVVQEEPIAVSDSSEDEVALRRKLLLLEDELKKTKKKTKKKEKRAKKQRKKSKVSKSGSDPTVSNSEKSDGQAELSIDESRSMKVTISSAADIIERRVVTQAVSEVKTDVVSPVKKVKSEESNEEGEIVSDSDDQKMAMDSLDLRHRLGRQIGPMLPSISQNKSKIPDLRDKLSVKVEGKETPTPGPTLPPHMRAKEKVQFDDGNNPAVEGPALPPHLKKNLSEKSKYMGSPSKETTPPPADSNAPAPEQGPSLTAEMRENLAKRAPSPEPSDSDDGGDIVGPLPAGATGQGLSAAQARLEERALRMKIGSLEGAGAAPETEAREAWMLELPDAKAKIIGLGPRQFRAKAGPDMSDRSSWTDTPEQKALKALGVPQVDEDQQAREDLKREAELHFITQRDQEQEEAAKKHKKKHKRDKSLLEIHEKKLEKKKKKDAESGEPTRRPFDRDIDLKANRFDEAAKKSILKKAQLLDTRFSKGENKFL